MGEGWEVGVGGRGSHIIVILHQRGLCCFLFTTNELYRIVFFAIPVL